MGEYDDIYRWSQGLYRIQVLHRRVSISMELMPAYNTSSFHFHRMKALLFTLIRAFDFELAVPATDIGKKASVTNRPVLLTAESEEEQNQMPLFVSPLESS